MPEASSVLGSKKPLSREELRLVHAWWRAANYLSVGQIYLLDNALLKEPLELRHIKPRLLGHWGTAPGLNLLYVHLNRVIKANGLSVIYVTGPGHGAPGILANTWLEGTYSEVYPHIPRNELGMQRLFKQFSFPGGIPSHAAPETPGSIHEGGELGYALSHAYGAVFDNPDLIAACVVGDGEAETGPMAAAWHSNKFLSPATDGAVLPILHLNGYKIANPTILARIGREELQEPVRGLRLQALLRRGRRSRSGAPAHGRDARQRGGRNQVDSESRPRAWQERPRDLADDRPQDAEGLDGTQGGGRPQDRGLLALASGAACRACGQAGPHQAARRLDEELPARGAFRRGRRTAARNRRAGARGRAAA